jgi:hypothetical protein
MNWGLHFTAACGLTAFLAMAGTANAANITYDLSGDGGAAYTDPNWPGYGYVDLLDSSTASGRVPSHTVSVGDTLHVMITLSQAVTSSEAFVFLQKAPGSTFELDESFKFFNGGTEVFAPSSWLASVGSGQAIGIGIGDHFSESDEFTFDKLIADVVILGMSSPTLTLPETWADLELYGHNFVATTPLPGGLLLMMTALGGLGVLGRRKRALAAAA